MLLGKHEKKQKMEHPEFQILRIGNIYSSDILPVAMVRISWKISFPRILIFILETDSSSHRQPEKQMILFFSLCVLIIHEQYLEVRRQLLRHFK